MSILNDSFLQLQADRLETGRKGEAWVAAREEQKLVGTPFSVCLDSGFSSQMSSFDIKSCTRSGEPLYIEVKSTDGEPNDPFFMSEREYAFAQHCLRHGIPYELHRVHHVLDDHLRDEIVYSAEDVIQLFERTPASYIMKRRDDSMDKQDKVRQAEPEYLPWEDCAQRIPGTRCHFYLAKIEGPHDEYRFDRKFQHGKYEYQADKIWLSCNIESTGVYEESMQWKDSEGKVLQRQRDWFLLIDGRAYDLEPQDVLNAVDSLKKRAA